jgi:hypothetical protein
MRISLLPSRQPGDGGEGFAEFEVVGFYAVIEVEFDAGLGERQHGLALPLFTLVNRLGDFVGFFAGFRFALAVLAVACSWVRWARRLRSFTW